MDLGPRHCAGWQIEPGRNLLICEDRQVRLEPKAMEVLLYLVDHAGRVVSKDRLIGAVWPGRFVTEHVLTVAIYELRKALGDSAREPRYIETVRQRGYRWLPSVEERAAAGAPALQGGAPAEAAGDAASHFTGSPPGSRFDSWPHLSGWIAAAGAVILLAMAVVWRGATGTERDARGVPEIRSLAVLPLEDLSPQVDDTVFADGMTECLVTSLAQLGPLRVTSRSSTLSYRGRAHPATQVAAALGVDALIAGSVTRADGRVRVTVRLIDPRTDSNLWAGSYERAAGDLLQLQGDVARAVAREIRLETGSVPLKRPLRPEAFEAWSRGRHHWLSQTPGSARLARDYFLEALTWEPRYAAAHAGLADALCFLFELEHRDPALPARARAAAQRALELDPRLSAAHLSMGQVRVVMDWDLDAGLRHYRRAIELDPSNLSARRLFGGALLAERRFAEAEVALRSALRLDPANAATYGRMVVLWLATGELDRAAGAARQIIELETRPGGGHLALADVYAMRGKGHEAAAFAAYREAFRFRHWSDRRLAGLDRAFARDGLSGVYRYLLDGQYFQGHTVLRAGLHARLGEAERALDLLAEAFDRRLTEMLWLDVNYRLQPLRRDPRYQALRERARRAGGPAVLAAAADVARPRPVAPAASGGAS